MDPLVAARVRKPRRTNSAPGNAFRAARNRSTPSALVTALFGKREVLPQFAVKTLLSAERRPAAADDVARDVTEEEAIVPTQSSNIPLSLSTEALQEIDMQDILQQMNESSAHQSSSKRSKKDGLASSTTSAERTNSGVAAAPEGEEEEEGSSAGDSSRTPSKDRPDEEAIAAVEEDAEFDVDETRYLFNKLKETTGCCSDKVSRFVQELWDQLGDGETGMMLLGRDAMAAPAVATSRKRRLFGAKEPELHQRVLGVLNKVTDDKSKYREIKFELMRLPLPEADPASLEQVVKCFFAKAVREQRFSSHYADLVEEICRVPPTQIQLGDTTQSLSYRLRVALLRRCQEEFANHMSMVEIARDAAKKSMTPDEIEALKAEEKNKLCGNVKFVGELFLRKMVSARIIQLILIQLLCGTNNADVLNAPMPPKYVPEAYECDQVITMLMTTGEALMKTELGAQTVAAVMKIARYFTQHHPVQRTRFVLLDLIDAEARKFGKKVPGAPKAKMPVAPPEPPLPAATTPMSVNKGVPAPSYTIARRPDASTLNNGSSVPPLSGRPGPPPALSTDSPLSSRTSSLPTSATKGATPQSPMIATPKRASVPTTPAATAPPKAMIPAPRSAGGASPLAPQNSGGSMGTPMGSTGPRVPPTIELVGPLMSSLSTSSDFSAMAREIMQTFTSAKSAMDLWTQRALNLIKAETERYQIAPLLIALHTEHNVPAADLRQTTVDALNRCIDDQLYEGGYRLWKFWAQIVAGDTTGIILDDQLHNEVFRRVLEVTLDPETKEIDKTIARSFMVDVISVDNIKPDVYTSSSRFTTISSNYSRFRPLNVLTSAAVAMAKAKAPAAPAGTRMPSATIPATKSVIDIVACPAIMKLQDVELNTYIGIVKGKPSRDELMGLFRTPKIFSSAFTPAKVLSAVYHAEYAEQARSFLETNIDLIGYVIDSAERHLREMALVLELYHCVKGIAFPQRSMNEGQRWMSRLRASGVVTSETHGLAHQRLQHDRDAELAIGPIVNPSHGASNKHGNGAAPSHDGVHRGSQRAIQHSSHHSDPRR